jgi:hypothetical protein
MANTRIKPGLGKRMVDGKSFRLAGEVRYIQRRAADHTGRVISIGQLILFSTKTGDAWLLDPSDNSLHGWPVMGTPNRSTSKRLIPPSRSAGRATIESRDRHSSTLIATQAEPAPSSDIRRIN